MPVYGKNTSIGLLFYQQTPILLIINQFIFQYC